MGIIRILRKMGFFAGMGGVGVMGKNGRNGNNGSSLLGQKQAVRDVFSYNSHFSHISHSSNSSHPIPAATSRHFGLSEAGSGKQREVAGSGKRFYLLWLEGGIFPLGLFFVFLCYENVICYEYGNDF